MPSRTYKFRGSRTHGRGIKAGRGKGKRGGTGNAGYHKHKYMSVLKYMPDYFGRHGFKRHPAREARRVINLSDIELNLERYLQEKVARKEGNMIELNLTALGYDKLLGSGSVSRALRIHVAEASENAVSKVKETGGSVELAGEEKPKPEKQ